jgi:hypothetical protein
MDEMAPGAVAGENIHAVVTALEGGGAVVEVEIASRFFRAVAAETGGLEDRLDIAGEINGDIGGRGQLGCINLGGSRAGQEKEKQGAAGHCPSLGGGETWAEERLHISLSIEEVRLGV